MKSPSRVARGSASLRNVAKNGSIVSDINFTSFEPDNANEFHVGAVAEWSNALLSGTIMNNYHKSPGLTPERGKIENGVKRLRF